MCTASTTGRECSAVMARATLSPSEQPDRPLPAAPLPEHHPALPQVLERGEALVHLLRRCLRAVAAERPPRRRAITLVERDRRCEQRRGSRVQAEPEPPRAVRDPIGREPDEVESGRLGHGTRLEEL